MRRDPDEQAGSGGKPEGRMPTCPCPSRAPRGSGVLGFELTEGRQVVADDGRPKRWVVVRPSGGGAGLVLASSDEQADVVGRQAGGRVRFFLRVDDVDAAFARLVQSGATIDRLPRTEPYGRVAVFR